TEHSGGYVDMNIIIPLNLSKMDVYKGPSSPLFGLFARGGAFSFETRKGGDYQDLSLTTGSYDTFDGQFALGNTFELNDGHELKTNFAVQTYRTRGYMENSEFLKANVDGRVAYNFSDKTEIALNLKGHSGRWDAPGFITKAMLEDKHERRYQAKNAENDGGRQVLASERIELSHDFNDNVQMLIYAYSIQQSHTRFSKFGLEPGPGEQTEELHSRNTYSLGGSLNGNHKIGSVGADWVAGVEYYNEFTRRGGWGTFNRVRQNEAPVEQNKYRLRSVSAYGQGEFEVSQYFRPSIGFRYESFGGTLKDRLASEKFNMNTLDHFSPKLGVRSTL